MDSARTNTPALGASEVAKDQPLHRTKCIADKRQLKQGKHPGPEHNQGSLGHILRPQFK